MIAGKIHEGSGLGNQIHRYVMVRVLALDKGLDFGFEGIDNFKGKSFMNLDWGKPVTGIEHYVDEKRVNNASGVDIRPLDEEISKIGDNTLIDGEFQAEGYFKHRLKEIREWLEVRPILDIPSNWCIINFRGGEYKYSPDLFLTKEYWQGAMNLMIEDTPDIEFYVVTDDIGEANRFFPGLPISHDIGDDWRWIRYAPNLILSNSSFAILSALLNENVKTVIAPKYWARRNVSDGYWAMEQNKYDGWTYI